jgi:hypothetical protein
MAAITTIKSAQTAIIKYYSSALQSKNVEPIKSSRGAPHLRINYAGDVLELMNSILPCEIELSDVKISGTYATQELKIKKDIQGAVTGDKIYLIIAISSKGVLKTKQLTPDKLGFGDTKTRKLDFRNKVVSSIESAEVPDNIKRFLNDLLEASSKVSGQITSKELENISESDLNIIAKDFGELSGAYWYLNVYNKSADAISYPKESNAPLVDYYVHIGNNKIAISAKANEGAPPSINAIAEVLKTVKYNDVEKEQARKAVISISESSTLDGIVRASRDLNTPGYKWLKANIFNKKDFEAGVVEAALASYKTPESVTEKLSSFYSEIKRSASADITKRIFDTKAKRNGLIISPLGYSLVDELNNNDDYLSILNDAAKSIVVSQLYAKINKKSKTVSYEVKQFSASSFKFEYNANAGQPSLKKISFKMVKKSI